MQPNRFVILEHFHQGVHYDLMLEVDGVLKTWRLEQAPTAAPQRARSSFDHRLIYLDHEGPISGDRGHVVRWDRGVYEGAFHTGASMGLRLVGERKRWHVLLKPLDDLLWEIVFVEE